MSDTAIKVENLSKRYRIGVREEQHETLVGALASWVKSPVDNYRRLKKLSRFEENGEADDILWALKDVSFEVKRGEVVGVIGRNGAGKSTLLKILSRITEPTSGFAEIHGRVSSLLEVGTGFHPELTGRENIYLNGTILGMAKAEIDRKFDEIVDFSEVEKFIDTPVKRYSSGMYVRLAFAVAAHLEPDILIVDEVLAVGDTEFQQKCLGKMRTVASEGRTVLFVSHNMQAIERLCDCGLLLRNGELAYEGTVLQVCQEYRRGMKFSKLKSLTEHRSQQGNGRAWITKYEVINASGGRCSQVEAGHEILIRIHYNATEIIQSPSLGFALLTAGGVRILNTSTSDSGAKILYIDGVGAIDLYLRDITLALGQYLCHLSISDRIGNYCDYLIDLPLFEIIQGSALPNSRTYDQSSGVVYANSEWNVRGVYNE